MDPVLKRLYPAFLRVHLLHHAAEGCIYGSQMIDELGRHGYRLSPGTLYPILHALERAGYLSAHRETIAGKARKYYEITAPGKKVLREIRGKLAELAREVLPEEPSAAAGKSARKSGRKDAKKRDGAPA